MISPLSGGENHTEKETEELSSKDGCNAHFYPLDIKPVPGILSLALSLGQKKRHSSYCLCGRELTLSFVGLRFMILRLKSKHITLKSIPTEHSPFSTVHEEERSLPKCSPAIWICFIPEETDPQ